MMRATQSQQFLLPEGAKVMRKTFSVSSASSLKKRDHVASKMVALMGGAAALALMIAPAARAQQAQGQWAVPAGPVGSGGPTAQGKGGIAVLPPSPTGKLPNPFPSSVIGTPEKPLSSDLMPVSGEKIDGQINKAIQDADARLKDVNLAVGPAGSGNLKVAPLPVTTLNDDIQAAAMIHRMQVQKAEVQGAVDLWGAAYDGKREAVPGVSGATGGSPDGMAQVVPGGAPVTQPHDSAQDRVRQAQDEAMNREREEDRIRVEAQARHDMEMKRKKREMAGMQPVVSSIVGDPENAVATILIPFVGEKHGVVAGDTIQTYSGRMLEVVAVTENGVQVREGRKTFRLHSGDVVPSPAQGVAMLTEAAPAQDHAASGALGGALQSSGDTTLSGGQRLRP